MMMVIMGMVFPPVGIIVFVVSAATGVPAEKVYAGTAVLLIPVIVTTGLLMIFPELALALPNSMRG